MHQEKDVCNILCTTLNDIICIENIIYKKLIKIKQ